jgi:hypothetical protein
MVESAGTTAAEGQLALARDQLVILRQRVASAASRAPHRDASGWNGVAAFAYQRSLDALAQELAGATELLRSAADLASAAVWEMGGHV